MTEREATRSTSWGSNDTADEARRNTERKAFDRLVDEFVASWPKLLQHYENKADPAPQPAAAGATPSSGARIAPAALAAGL